MKIKYHAFEHYSAITGVGVSVLGLSGEPLFESSLYGETAGLQRTLHGLLDCEEACRVALLYGCYQARRFSGRYIFLAPSGLTYCASHLLDINGNMVAGVLVGPFLMTDYDEYMDIDIMEAHAGAVPDAAKLRNELERIPMRTPAQARAMSEHLFICSAHYSFFDAADSMAIPQTDAFPSIYPLDKEDELISAVSIGDIETARGLLNDILGQILFYSGNDLEILRSRVVELTVLLSRAALKGGARIDAIFGLNYSYLREIDALSSAEEIVLWLHNITRRFTQHVFNHADTKHADIIYRAVAFIKKNYAQKFSLQDVSDHVFLSLTYFCKIFKEKTGQTPGSYITAVRIEESKKLLRDSFVNIIDIPELVGFESQSYFTRVFKKEEGCTPGRYRQNKQGDPHGY